jgi:hypothetical protein
MEQKWREPGFVEAATAWVDARLADLGRLRTGEPEQPHVTDWSTVLRVPTDAGDVWFKANDHTMLHEGALWICSRPAPTGASRPRWPATTSWAGC